MARDGTGRGGGKPGDTEEVWKQSQRAADIAKHLEKQIKETEKK
jgi:hypothetical protein